MINHKSDLRLGVIRIVRSSLVGASRGLSSGSCQSFATRGARASSQLGGTDRRSLGHLPQTVCPPSLHVDRIGSHTLPSSSAVPFFGRKRFSDDCTSVWRNRCRVLDAWHVFGMCQTVSDCHVACTVCESLPSMTLTETSRL